MSRREKENHTPKPTTSDFSFCFILIAKKKSQNKRAHPDLNRGPIDLQSIALPLSYRPNGFRGSSPPLPLDSDLGFPLSVLLPCAGRTEGHQTKTPRKTQRCHFRFLFIDFNIFLKVEKKKAFHRKGFFFFFFF